MDGSPDWKKHRTVMEDAGRVSGKKKRKKNSCVREGRKRVNKRVELPQPLMVGSSLVFVPNVGLSFHTARSAFLYRSL